MQEGLARECFGEALGTFIMVFIGCAAVGAADILGWLTSLYQVAFFWMIGVTMAILMAKNWSSAHLNPAVSMAMCITGKSHWNRLLPYFLAQVLGAFLAAALLYQIFSEALSDFEQAHGIIRGAAGSERSAMMFGEYFPNPAFSDHISISWPAAMFLEGIGTFILVFMIFIITRKIKSMSWVPALLIGMVVGLLICFIAPYTQCGINPARDLGPRLVSFIHGWHSSSMLSIHHSSIYYVYFVAPFLGSVLAAFTVSKLGLT